MAKIKICGLRREEDAQFVNDARPDLAGFVFAPSKRQIKLKQAIRLRQLISDDIPTVGVFVDAPLVEMVDAVKSGAISIVQLHGGEDETVVAALQSNGIPVIKVTRETTQANYQMVDSGKGSGVPLDWNQIVKQPHKPLFLAGGLNTTNIIEAIEKVAPDFVDVSSGAETKGIKDFDKINELVKLAHGIA